MKQPLDRLLKPIKVGDTVLRAVCYGNTPNLDWCNVTAIVNGQVFLDGSKIPIIFTDRLVVVR